MTTTTPYQPEVGDTLFVSYAGNKPTLVTINKKFPQDQFEFIDVATKSVGVGMLRAAVFYPDAPAYSKYVYVATMEQHGFMDASEFTTLGYFFDVEEAFNYVKAVENCEITPDCIKAVEEFVTFSVAVQKV